MLPLGRSFTFEVLEDLELLVSYQGPRSPTDSEWAPYVQLLGRLHRGPYRYITFSDGGYPSRTQQTQVEAVTRGHTPPVSIVSSSIAIRFVGALLALFNPRVQCFAPEQLDRAFAHIGVAAKDTRKVRACLAALRAQVDAGRRAA